MRFYKETLYLMFSIVFIFTFGISEDVFFNPPSHGGGALCAPPPYFFIANNFLLRAAIVPNLFTFHVNLFDTF